jgi:putative oxidoreductase
MFQRLLQTDNDTMLFVLRLMLGLVILPHGAQKLLGWFGGYGYRGTMGYFGGLGIPALFGFLAIMAEFFGGLALLAGLFGRVAALGVGVTMLTAAMMVHVQNGFFMNWFGNQKGEGVEYFLLGIAVSVAVVLGGSGAWSVDRLLSAS